MGVSQYLGVSRRCPTWDQNSIFFLELDPIPFLGLDLIDPRSSSLLTFPRNLSKGTTEQITYHIILYHEHKSYANCDYWIFMIHFVLLPNKLGKVIQQAIF